MKKIGLVITTVLILIIGCNNKKHANINTVEVLDNENKEVKVDTTLLEIADLPVYIDSTEYLIHPIGFVNKSRKGIGYIYKSSRGKNDGFHLSNNYRDEITGNMNNLKFQKKNSNELKLLTKNHIKVKSVRFLRDIFNNLKKKMLLYEIVDTDSNKDGKITLEDIEGLYLSKVNGDDFIKITKPNHKVLMSKIVKELNRLYFKTLIKKSEKAKVDIHYFYIDFNDKEIKVTEYFPLN
ncbi:hypothetical protein [Tenacibaculum holothuriorum]|nr:hypothetical protein [Tenacibaculum holothuriorum]